MQKKKKKNPHHVHQIQIRRRYCYAPRVARAEIVCLPKSAGHPAGFDSIAAPCFKATTDAGSKLHPATAPPKTLRNLPTSAPD
ncbi:hypothetical protein PUN28_016613 [Cardiocondyla obscurior]|uniref:Uncharacterized protein n=1 Tax=Cardiocondyla obscurior TaxID=286306 RepID=A0AAW2EMW8_9HYME